MTYHDDTHAHPAEPAGSQVNVNAGHGGTDVYHASPMAPIRRIINLIFGVIIALIGLRVMLLVLGANEGNAIVDGIYAIT